MSCPICGQNEFYIKDPNDEYECYNFSIRNGKVCFDEATGTEEHPFFTEATEAFCSRCSWHNKLKTIQNN